jgi:uncharacterized protein YkwD
MRKFKILFLVFALGLIGGLIFLFWDEFLSFYLKLPLKSPGIEKGISDFLTKEIEKQVSTPPPLRAEKEAPESYLTRAGIIQWTNAQRAKYGLQPLKENPRLNVSAELKVQDMFEKQYFAHLSPSGEGVKDLVEIAGYEYIAIGENLALGNFQNDEALVQGWMDSPGHRANILNPSYEEIGVAVQKGEFEGRTTWLAVQHFGRPLSACPQPDTVIKAQIDSNQNEIEKLQANLLKLEAEIKNTKPKRDPAYTQKIEEYNALVSQYNTLIDQTKSLITNYNNQVNLFNQCVSGTE